jgi:DNA-binding transcriptional LysR family regulator
MLYDTVLLRTFAAICDAGSFTKAAREVNLTQSAVSPHVKRLEDQVGSRLIMRNTRGVRLTEHGEIFLSYARRILDLYKEAEHRLSRDSGGLVRIGAPEYFDLHTLSALLGQFSARYPAVRLQIELGIGPDISALLDEGRARSRDRQQRDQGGRRRLAVPRAEGLGCRTGDASRSQRACASRALSAILPVAAARFGGIGPGRPAMDSRVAERRHGGYRRSPRRRAFHHHLSRVQPAE